MGLDIFEIVMRCEREFHIDIVQEDINQLSLRREPPDIAAGEWHDLIWKRYSDWIKHSNNPEQERLCAACGYNLFGLWIGSRCPECGHPEPATAEAAWWATCNIISNTTGCNPNTIRRESLFRRDLGVS